MLSHLQQDDLVPAGSTWIRADTDPASETDTVYLVDDHRIWHGDILHVTYHVFRAETHARGNGSAPAEQFAATHRRVYEHELPAWFRAGQR